MNTKEKIDELHCKFSLYGRTAKEWARKCMVLLPEIEKYKVWREKGFSCLYEYAAKLAGLTKNQVNESLRIIKKIEDKPVLIGVLEQKGIWAVRPVASIATKENEGFWAEKVRSMTKNELEVYVKSFQTLSGRPRTVGTGDTGVTDSCGGIGISGKDGHAIVMGISDKDSSAIVDRKIEIKIKLSPETLNELDQIKGEDDYETAIIKLIKMRREQIELKKPEPVRTESRHIPNHIKKYVEERDGRICVFPGCTRKYRELHHANRFFSDNVHDPGRIFCLCAAHHSLAHRGLIDGEDLEPKFWKVKNRAELCYVDRMVAWFRRTF